MKYDPVGLENSVRPVNWYFISILDGGT